MLQADAQPQVVVVDDLRDDLQAAEGVAFLLFARQPAQDLHEVVVVVLKDEDGEVAFCYFAEDAVCFLLDDLVFFVLEACADDAEDEFPAGLEVQRVVDHEVAETADHQLLHCEYFGLLENLLEGLQVLPLQPHQVLSLQELGNQLLEEVRSEESDFVALVLTQLAVILLQLSPKYTQHLHAPTAVQLHHLVYLLQAEVVPSVVHLLSAHAQQRPQEANQVVE